MTAQTTNEHLIELARGRAVLLISPHPDDIALSVGGLVRLLRGSCELTMLTIFTHSIAAPTLPPEQRTDSIVSSLRAEEDEQYCNALGIRRVALELGDASVRFADRTLWHGLPDPMGSCFVAARKEIAPIIAKKGWDIVVLPMGLGDMIDHLIARDSVLGSIARSDESATLVLYEDLPYVQQFDLPYPKRAAQGLLPSCEPLTLDIEECFESKIRDIQLYRTQIRTKELDAVTEYARKVGGGSGLAERVWIGKA